MVSNSSDSPRSSKFFSSFFKGPFFRRFKRFSARALKVLFSLWLLILIFILFSIILVEIYGWWSFWFYAGTMILALFNIDVLIRKPHIPAVIAVGFIITDFAFTYFFEYAYPKLNTFSLYSLYHTSIAILLFIPLYFLGWHLRRAYKH